MAWLLAFVLVASHAAFGTMAPEVGAITAPAASMHSHCADHATQTADHSRHCGAASCCRDKTCTCTQACVTPALAMTIAMPPPIARVFAMPSPRTLATIESPLLRPPIA